MLSHNPHQPTSPCCMRTRMTRTSNLPPPTNDFRPHRRDNPIDWWKRGSGIGENRSRARERVPWSRRKTAGGSETRPRVVRKPLHVARKSSHVARILLQAGRERSRVAGKASQRVKERPPALPAPAVDVTAPLLEVLALVPAAVVAEMALPAADRGAEILRAAAVVAVVGRELPAGKETASPSGVGVHQETSPPS